MALQENIKMILVDVTIDMINFAIEESKRLGVLNNSIRNGNGNIVGVLGELAVLKHFKEATKVKSYEYDVEYQGKKIEVKSQQRKVIPTESYDVNVSNYNPNQTADYYFFTSVTFRNNCFESVYLLGYYPKNEYIKTARLIKKGEVDLTNNWICSADCYSMQIKDLFKFKEIN
jgi:hypothetical protein